MMDTLKKNDKVLTTGGIYATVISVDTAHDKVVLASRRRAGSEARVHACERRAGARTVVGEAVGEVTRSD